MPELPEVETTVRFLRKKVRNRAFIDVWTDFAKMLQIRQGSTGQVKKGNFEDFRKQLKNKKIQKIWRRGKNIILELSCDKTLLIHQKLTGHLLVGYWIMDNGYWKPKSRGFLGEKVNTYIHLLFTMDNGLMLGLSDLRKFAKVELWDTEKLKESKAILSLGPEPLAKDFTFEKFKEYLKNKKGKIKQVLMNQEVIAGIGNIYSDEILWEAKVNPCKEIKRLSDKEIKKIYDAMRKILEKAIKVQGESISDYRTPTGERGGFDKFRKAYRREGEKCSRCQAVIKKTKIGGRSAHFCPKCQTL